MARRVIVAGVGMIPFAKPGASEPYDVMGSAAAKKALADAGLSHADVQQAIVGYVYGDSTCGQAAVYRVGMTGIRSEEHTSELQSLMRIAYAVFCLKKKNRHSSTSWMTTHT